MIVNKLSKIRKGFKRFCLSENDKLTNTASVLVGAVVQKQYEAKIKGVSKNKDSVLIDFETRQSVSEKHFADIEAKVENLLKEKSVVELVELTDAQAMGLGLDFPSKNGVIKAACFKDTIMQIEGVASLKGTERVRLINTSHVKEGDNYHKRLEFAIFKGEKELEEFEEQKKIQEEYDHRAVGKEKNLFFFSRYAPGAPFFLPEGAQVVNKLLDMLREQYKKRNYKEVKTPQLFNLELWKTSGHYKNYKENLFILDQTGKNLAVKPMNCPSHCLIYKQMVSSETDLPLKLADFGSLHRNEVSGSLGGLTRCIKFTCDDAHIFCTESQIEEEIKDCLNFVETVYSKFGFKYELELSTRPENSLGSDSQWERAEKALEKAIEESGNTLKINSGDGAFYGPKIDIYLLDIQGRRHQCGTIQLDFQLPIRFNLQYQSKIQAKKGETLATEEFDADNYSDKPFTWREQPVKKGYSRPVIVHRAILGSIERFLAILLENCKGKLPFWLSSRQVGIVPVFKGTVDYSNEIANRLEKLGLSCSVFNPKNKLSKNIASSSQSYSVTLILGEKEASTRVVSLREGSDSKEMSLAELEEYLELKSKPDLTELEQLEIRLKRRLFLGGDSPSEEDTQMSLQIPLEEAENYPNISKWKQILPHFTKI